MKHPRLLDYGNLTDMRPVGYGSSLCAGGGTVVQTHSAVLVKTSATASSKGAASQALTDVVRSDALIMNFDKFTRIVGKLFINNSTQATGRMQVKAALAEGALGAIGLGLSQTNGALHGESFGTVLNDLDLGVALANRQLYDYEIRHYPANRIEWWINGDLKGTVADTTKIPSGSIAYPAYHIISIADSGAGGVVGWMGVETLIWQEN